MSDEDGGLERGSPLPERGLRTLLENIPGVVYRCLPREPWTVLFVSDEIEALSGWPASDFLGEPPVRSLGSLVHPEDEGPATEEIRTAVAENRPYVNEYRVIDSGGGVHWVIGKGQAVLDASGRALHLDGTIFDITDRKVMEEDLRHAKEEAEAASLAKTEFLAQMSHDLRSPLNAILGFVDLLIQDPVLAEDHREKLGIVGRSGRHLLDMIDQILHLSRLEGGADELRVEKFDLVEALEDLVQLARSRAAEKGIRFSLELDPAIAPCVRGDAGKIRQVLTNLIGNAVRYTTEGGVWLRARSVPLEGDASRLTLEFDVADTGPGIPKNQLDRIFDHFVRGDMARDSDSGVGLGLAIARALVQKMGGRIAAASEPGRGSLFKVRIPVRAADPESGPDSDPAEVVGLQPGQPEWRILVVEDGADSRLLLATILKKAGFAVREAENGEVAVNVAGEWRPHMIWMDLHMRVMDGYEATQAIRRLPEGESVKIVAISAGARMEPRSAVLDAGFDELMGKPFLTEEIFAAMARLLGVRYRRAGAEQTATSSVALSAGMLAELPPGLLEPLREAALRLDREATNEVIAAIREHAPATAMGLSSLMRRFRMGRLLELLGETDEGEGEA